MIAIAAGVEQQLLLPVLSRIQDVVTADKNCSENHNLTTKRAESSNGSRRRRDRRKLETIKPHPFGDFIALNCSETTRRGSTDATLFVVNCQWEHVRPILNTNLPYEL